MGSKVLDSSALVAYFEGEASGAAVSQMLKEASSKNKPLFISVVNWGEVLCVTERRNDARKRDEVEKVMEQMCLDVVSVDRNLTRAAAHIRATQKLPYGDCFAAALALDKEAELVTKDKDFKSVEDKIHIQWI